MIKTVIFAETRDTLPAPVRDYVARIESLLPDTLALRPVSFRKILIEQTQENTYRGLRREVGKITVAPDGAVSAPTVGKAKGEADDAIPDLAPTAAEAEAIKAASRAFPRSIELTANAVHMLAKDLAEHRGEKNPLWVFRDRSGEGVSFVQERLTSPEGDKRDVPWSPWSDGPWRMMEPDGLLPLHGLEELADTRLLQLQAEAGRRGLPWGVLVHEGAKASTILQRKRQDARLGNGPAWDVFWGPFLACCPHVGWPGGAPNPHRVDWEPLRQLPHAVPIIIVADNDRIGEEAVKKISGFLGRSVLMLRFGGSFPPNFDAADFDVADGYPKLVKNGLWVGPRPQACLAPATTATKLIPPPPGSKGAKPTIAVTEAFASEWIYTVRPSRYIHRTMPNWAFDETEFNDLVAPFSHTKDTATPLKQLVHGQAVDVVYDPSLPPGQVASNDTRRLVVNTCQPSLIKPKPGDAGPWLDFLRHLIPDKGDREHLMNWVATLIGRPDIKMTHAILLVSENQRVGKSTLIKFLTTLIGLHNCSVPLASTIVEESFNDWQVEKRLVSIHEVQEGNGSKIYKKLQSVISEDTVRASIKYVTGRTVANWAHVIAASNFRKAVRITWTDCRWFVPKVTEETQDKEKWVALNAWFEAGGQEIIAHWAQERVKDPRNVIQKGEDAPRGTGRTEVVEAGQSDGERMAREFAEHMMEVAPKAVVRMDSIREFIGGETHRIATATGVRGWPESPEKISAVLRGAGLKVHRREFKNGGRKFRIVYHEAELADDVRWEDIAKLLQQPLTIWNKGVYRPRAGTNGSGAAQPNGSDTDRENPSHSGEQSRWQEDETTPF